MIKIDENYRIEADATDGVVLIFSEPRQKKNKETEEFSDYIYEDKYYYPTVYTALKKYCHLYQEKAVDVEDLLTRTDELFDLMKTLLKN